jgi:hypothetical protein
LVKTVSCISTSFLGWKYISISMGKQFNYHIIKWGSMGTVLMLPIK